RQLLELGDPTEEPEPDLGDLYAVAPRHQSVPKFVDDDAGEEPECRDDAEQPGSGASSDIGGRHLDPEDPQLRYERRQLRADQVSEERQDQQEAVVEANRYPQQLEGEFESAAHAHHQPLM